MLRQYAVSSPEIQILPAIEHVLDNEEVPEYLDDQKERGKVSDFMLYMLETGMSNKEILDFFSRRDNAVRRAAYMDVLKDAYGKYSAERKQRRSGTEKLAAKTATVDIGINDWYHFGLQESLNQAQHTNNKQEEPASVQPGQRPYNFRSKKKQPQPPQGPRSVEGLLGNKHDQELGYMKTTEQLLRESQT